MGQQFLLIHSNSHEDQAVTRLVLKAIDPNLLFQSLWHVCGT